MHTQIQCFVLAILFSFLMLTNNLQAQKAAVYGEVGLGAGQSLFFGNAADALENALEGRFNPNIGPNLMIGFFYAPESWKGLGLGSRIHGTFGMPANGTNNSAYIFNYYNLAISAKYFFSQTFNRGLYTRASLGFGQFTAKRMFEAEQEYVHQYVIGGTYSVDVGYALPLKKTALSLELHFEFSSRNGTVQGVAESVIFDTGQLGVNLLFSF